MLIILLLVLIDFCLAATTIPTVDISFGRALPKDHAFDAYCPQNSHVSRINLYKYASQNITYLGGLIFFCSVLDDTGKLYTSKLYGYVQAQGNGNLDFTTITLPVDRPAGHRITNVGISIWNDTLWNVEIDGSVATDKLMTQMVKASNDGCELVGFRGTYDDIALRSLVLSFKNCKDQTVQERSINTQYGKMIGLPSFEGQSSSGFICNPGQYLVRVDGNRDLRLNALKFVCSDGEESPVFGDQSSLSNPVNGEVLSEGIYAVSIGYHLSERRMISLAYGNTVLGNDGSSDPDPTYGQNPGEETYAFTIDSSGNVVMPFGTESDGLNCKAVGVQVWSTQTQVNSMQMIYDCTVNTVTVSSTPISKQQTFITEQLDSLDGYSANYTALMNTQREFFEELPKLVFLNQY